MLITSLIFITLLFLHIEVSRELIIVKFESLIFWSADHTNYYICTSTEAILPE